MKIRVNIRDKRTAAKPPRGFTLIELLVVIAIIAILASILFPVFARARENARKASCMSNLKQIGLAIMQYTQDYDEHYGMGTRLLTDPPCNAFFPQTGHFGAQSWMDDIYPYTKSWQIYYCPSGPPAGTDGSYYASAPATITDKFGYGANGFVLRQIPYSGIFSDAGCSVFADFADPARPIPNGAPTALSFIGNPAGTVLLGDRGTWARPDLVSDAYSGTGPLGQGGGGAGYDPAYFDSANPSLITTYGGTPDYRHNGFANFLFCDGHVKSFNISQVGAFSDTTSKGYTMMNPLTGLK